MNTYEIEQQIAQLQEQIRNEQQTTLELEKKLKVVATLFDACQSLEELEGQYDKLITEKLETEKQLAYSQVKLKTLFNSCNALDRELTAAREGDRKQKLFEIKQKLIEKSSRYNRLLDEIKGLAVEIEQDLEESRPLSRDSDRLFSLYHSPALSYNLQQAKIIEIEQCGKFTFKKPSQSEFFGA